MSDPVARLNTALEGRYHIERKLGEGGMATVYLAQDLRHDRSVALKVLKPELAAVVGADRFLAEIKTTASLQHPHILPLFDSGEADGFLFYVMPYVEGESLRERLDREKQLPVDDAVRIATAVANALDHAHRHDVIHRDIKPANILLQDGEPVVADFGIALAVGTAGGHRLTETGLSVGTPFYMSPEQATGDQMVGPASDLYATACVLYEMLTGDPPHVGPTAQAVLGKIIAGTVAPPTEFRPSIPANVDAAIRCGLEKLPADRFSSAHNFATALSDPGYRYREAMELESAEPTGPWNPLTIALSVTTVLLALAVGGLLLRSEPAAGVLRYSLSVPPGLGASSSFGPNLAISPDGTKLVTADLRDGNALLHLRERDQLSEQAVNGTEGAAQPFFAPDGQRIGFVTTGRELKLVSPGGGPPLTLVDSGVVRGGGSWSTDGYIYFARGTVAGGLGLVQGLSRISSAGGTPQIVSELDTTRAEVGHVFPDALPNGRGVLFSITRERLYEAATMDVAVVDLSNGLHRVLGPGVLVRWSPTGHILVVGGDGSLLAYPFDDRSLEITGPAIALLDDVSVDGLASADLALSENGTLTYVAGSSQRDVREPVWVSRSGEQQPIDVGWRGLFHSLRLSPEGGRLALGVTEAAETQIWIKQLDHGPFSKLTLAGPVSDRPNWHPGGRSLVFRSMRGENYDLFSRPADGSTQAELVLDGATGLNEVVYSPDGQWLVYVQDWDLYAQRLDSTEAPIALATSGGLEFNPAFSPDGRWLAFSSTGTGRPEVYVQPFPNTGDARWQVSTEGATAPAWAHSGRELFYLTTDEQMISVDVVPGSTFAAGESRALFSVRPFQSGVGIRFYDVGPNDERFVMLRLVTGADGGQIVVVENFFEELKQREPR
jgi:serine/threonine-protein kinase